jgi:hypothetical protein
VNDPFHLTRHSALSPGALGSKGREIIGGTPLVGSPADFGELIADDTEKWGKVIRATNIKPE